MLPKIMLCMLVGSDANANCVVETVKNCQNIYVTKLGNTLFKNDCTPADHWFGVVIFSGTYTTTVSVSAAVFPEEPG